MKITTHLLFNIILFAGLWACHSSGETKPNPKSAGVEKSRLGRGIYTSPLRVSRRKVAAHTSSIRN